MWRHNNEEITYNLYIQFDHKIYIKCELVECELIDRWIGTLIYSLFIVFKALGTTQQHFVIGCLGIFVRNFCDGRKEKNIILFCYFDIVRCNLRDFGGLSGAGRDRIVVGRRHGASSSLMMFGFSLGSGAGSLGGFGFSSNGRHRGVF